MKSDDYLGDSIHSLSLHHAQATITSMKPVSAVINVHYRAPFNPSVYDGVEAMQSATSTITMH